MTTSDQQQSSGRAKQKVIVIGGGIAGQTAGYRLHKRGFDVTLLEAHPTIIGGKMSSYRKNGFTFNRGSTLLPTSYDQLKGLAGEVGLGKLGEAGAIISTPRNGKNYLIRADGLASVIDAIKTDLISFKSKMTLIKFAIDMFKVKDLMTYERLGVEADDENLQDYCRRRLNPELEDYLIGSLGRGFYLYEAEELSKLDLFFSAMKFMGVGFFQYPGGIDFINQELAKILKPIMGARATNVEQHKDGVTVTWEKDGKEYSEKVDGCVMAITAPLVPKIYHQLTDRQNDILSNRIRYGSIIKGGHALKSKPDDPSMILSIPRCESESLGCITYEHNYSPLSVPPGRGQVSSHWMHEWNQSRLDPNKVSDEELEAEMIPEMERFIPGFRELLDFTYITRWSTATLCSYAGMYRLSDEFIKGIPATSRVHFCGDYLNVPSTNSSSVSGEKAAKRLAEALQGK